MCNRLKGVAVIEIKRLVMGYLENNVYIVKCSAGTKTATGTTTGTAAEIATETFVVDPSAKAAEIVNEIDSNSALKAIVCTHFHSDHTGGLSELAKITKAPVWAGKSDAQNIEEPKGASKNSTRLHKACKVNVRAKDGDTLEVGGISWKIIHTPGHSMGGICIYCAGEHNVIIDSKDYGVVPVLFSGDTLFQDTTGRTDFLGGSKQEMKESLKKLNTLPPETVVLPGHNNFTTIGHEQNSTFERWGI